MLLHLKVVNFNVSLYLKNKKNLQVYFILFLFLNPHQISIVILIIINILFFNFLKI